MRYILAVMLLLSPSWASAESYLQLVDRLDRPQDGYCLDVLGWNARTYRTDLPVNAHNCKAGRAPDGLVSFTSAGEIRFDAFDLCLTAHGVGGRSLPGAPLMLTQCGQGWLSRDGSSLQSFEQVGAQLQLMDSDLCLAVGAVSDRTFSARDRWRMLTLESCDAVPAARSEWAFVAPLG